jgi:thiol:disulfide interchange protein DsbA
MKLSRIALLVLVSFFAFANVYAAPQRGQEIQYLPIIPPQPTSADEGQVEVVEIFSYACSHCFRFEPVVQRWAKNQPKKVKFVQMPAIFNNLLALYARAFYAADALGVLDKVHQPFFDAIHVEKRHITTEAEIADLFAEHGVDKKEFEKAFRSFAVEARVRRAAELGRRYGVSATPSMVVNGKYLTDPEKGHGFRGMLDIVDSLVAKESKGG